MTERLLPGRWDDSRLPNKTELKATSIIELPIDSATAKIRGWEPKDEPEDYTLDYWAGVIPIKQEFLAPENDPKLAEGIPFPEYLKDYKR